MQVGSRKLQTEAELALRLRSRWDPGSDVSRHTPDGGRYSKLAAKYDEAAECWHDQLALLGYPRAYEDLFDRLLADGALNSLRDGGRVLDLGVGTGAFSLALAGKVSAPLRIEGVELSPSVLLRASLNLDRAGVETRLHLRDVKDLPFEENTFDAVIGAHVLEHLDDPFAGLSEMVRLLKPGGPLVVATHHGIPEAPLRPKWRHEHVAQDQLMFRMEGAGLIGIRAYPLLAGGSLPHRRCVAWVGFTEGVWQWSDT
jgi:ubiquinone/menaquinone biosynthesis C-methylase UbiE